MKKLMIAATAALCATVGFGIESDVVGYNTGSTVAGENMYTIASFIDLNGGTDATFTLGQIKPDPNSFSYWNSDYLATIDQYGAQDAYYTYDSEDGTTYNWYVSDADGNIDYSQVANDVVLPINQGIIVYSSSEAVLTYSGAVIKGDTALKVVAGENAYTGNFTPTTITLGDIVVDSNTFSYWNSDYLATIDQYGAQGNYYTYDSEDGVTFNWYISDADGNIDYSQIANDVEFPANTGFIIYASNDTSLSIPSPIE